MSTQVGNNRAQISRQPRVGFRAERNADVDAIDDDDAATPWSDYREVPPWAISLGVHLAILLILAGITRITFQTPDTEILSSLIDEIDPDTFRFEPVVVDQVGNEQDVQSPNPAQSAAKHVEQNPNQVMQQQLESEILTVKAPVAGSIPSPDETDLTQAIDTTGATEHPGGVEGAIDRLTYEIANSLRQRKTLVVWLFDASQSLKERRNVIADRFENVYRQLGGLDVETNNGALITAVASFGQRTHILTPEPVDDVAEIVAAVRGIVPDESGKENVFTAVAEVSKKWFRYRSPGKKSRRNIMLIIVTDERGDDSQRMEDVIHLVRRYGIRVYCVGNAAIFGREKGYHTWTYSDGVTEELPVDQGPETVAPERLQLAFWGGPSARNLGRMSASFGPYALTRLCAETGGLYLIAQESRGPRFDPAIMRNYLPDYRPIRDYQKQLVKNRAKSSLVQAAQWTRTKRIPTPQLTFRADNDNILRQQIFEAQKPWAVLDDSLNPILQVLLLGEKDRGKLKTPRWQASFDLAMGRVLAMRARALGYNMVLADMKVSPKPFQTPGNNQWRLVPSEEIKTGPKIRKLAKKATEYLTRVVEKHPGTPWALLAKRDLDQPLGWVWREAHANYAPNKPGGDNRTLLLAEEEKRRAMQKKKPPKKRVRPQL